MTNKLKLIIASVFASIFLSQPALAGSLRCGTHLVTGGDRDSPGKYEVLRRCGEPSDRYGNTWVYKDRGAAHVLRFSNEGQLMSVESGT